MTTLSRLFVAGALALSIHSGFAAGSIVASLEQSTRYERSSGPAPGAKEARAPGTTSSTVSASCRIR